MKKIINSLYLLLAVIAFGLVACNTDNTTSPSNPIPEGPDSLMASSKNDTTISFMFKVSASESDTNWLSYVLDIQPGAFAQKTINKGSNTFSVSGLQQGTVYTFTLHAKFKNGNLSTKSTSVTWSPAYRFSLTDNATPIKVYEYVSTFGSGLQYYDATSKASRVLTIASSNLWNLGLDTKNGAFKIGSPTKVSFAGNFTGGTPPLTEISSDYFLVNSDITETYDTQALNATATFGEMMLDFSAAPFSTLTKNLVLITRTKDAATGKYNYAKVMLINSGSGFLQGSAGNRYIQCVVSYQLVEDVPYARTTH